MQESGPDGQVLNPVAKRPTLFCKGMDTLTMRCTVWIFYMRSAKTGGCVFQAKDSVK